jgi:hypothetical protein
MPSRHDRDTAAFTAADALEVARHLQNFPSVILVGGQALNFWAEQFRAAVPALDRLAPFQSRDIDFLGSVADVEACAARLGGSAAYPSPDDAATPQVGIVHCVVNGKELRIDFLGYLAGVANRQARSSAIPAEIGDAVLRVLHPVAIVQSRLANIVTLRRRDPLALRQMRVAVLVAREYAKLAAAEDRRVALDLIEHLFQLACSRAGKRLWLDHGIDIAEAICPFPGLPETFARKRLPQMLAYLASKRERHARSQAPTAEKKRAEETRRRSRPDGRA